jgi:hypothetical protein
MEFLQDARNNLFTNGAVTPAKFQQFMKQIVDARDLRTPHPAQSLTEDQMNNLWNIRDDLRRQASAEKLAATRGSDTQANFIDHAKQTAKSIANMGVHGVLAAKTGGIGNIIYRNFMDARQNKLVQQQLQNDIAASLDTTNRLKPAPNRLAPGP